MTGVDARCVDVMDLPAARCSRSRLRDRPRAAAAARPRAAGVGRRGAGRAASWIGRRATSRWRSSSSRGSRKPRMAWAWSPFAAATGRAPRSGSAPRSRSTKISPRPTSTWRPRCVHRDAEADALVEARAALAVDPGYADARLLTAELLLRLGRLDDARWELEKLCAAAPERADAHAASALVLAAPGSNRGRGAGGAPGAAPSTHSCPRRTGRAPRSCAARAIWRRPAASWTSSSRRAPARSTTAWRTPPSPRRAGCGPRRRASWRRWSRRRRAGRRCTSRWPSSPCARGDRETALRAADAALALRARYPEARLVRADALSRLGRDAEMRRELERFLAEAPPAMARRTRPRRTNACARACPFLRYSSGGLDAAEVARDTTCRSQAR